VTQTRKLGQDEVEESGLRGVFWEAREATRVSKKGHTEEQILRALRQAESGTKVADICREHGVSEATYYVWKKKYSGLGLEELRELRQLREENGKLKRLVADLSLDRHVLQEIVRKKL
jgi:putative transposase